jgi:hypothetical protein
MATSAYAIEKSVPVPPRQGGPGNPRFPLAQLEVGDSFHVPFGESELKTRSVISNAVASFKLRNPPKDFRTRKDETGVRVWRIA